MYKRISSIFLFCCAFIAAVFFRSMPAAAADQEVMDQLEPYYWENGPYRLDYSYTTVIGYVLYVYQPDSDTFCAAHFDPKQTDIPDRIKVEIEPYVLGKPVVKIDDYFFKYGGRTNIRRIRIPDTITEPLCFIDSNLESVIMPKNMLNSWMLTESDNLRSVTLSDKVKGTGDYGECSALKYIHLSNELEKVSPYSFEGCISLTELTIPENTKSIMKAAFKGCKNLNLYVPPSVTEIGKNAFGKIGKNVYGQKENSKIKMLYCIKGSAAHKYAKKHKIPYTLVSQKASARKMKSLKAAKKKIMMEVHSGARAETVIKPFYAENAGLIYESSSPEVVSVDIDGELEARQVGKSVITVQAESYDKKTKMTVYVTPKSTGKLSKKRNGKRVTLSWKSAESAEGYEVWAGKKKKKGFKRILETEGTEAVIKSKKKKYYKVRAYSTVNGEKIYGPFGSVKKA